MNLYIMTKGRVGRQYTWEALPDRLREKTWLVCPPDEDHGFIPCIHEPSPMNYSEKFKWILEDGMGDGEDKAVIIDDDLKFSEPYLRTDGQRRLRALPDEHSSIYYGFNNMEDLLDDTALVSFHPRQMGHTKNPPYEENGKVVCVQGINRRIIGDVPDLDRFPILADVVLNATLLERGVGNKLITTLFIDWYPCQAEGGCSDTRTPEIQAEACYWLEERFGPYIKAVKKTPKSGWLGGERVDFRGQWKALYRAGASKVLDQ
jgi:hypothetical protein